MAVEGPSPDTGADWGGVDFDSCSKRHHSCPKPGYIGVLSHRQCPESDVWGRLAIVVDDDSADTAGNVLGGYHDPRVRSFLQPNGGRSVACNRGVSRLSGRYLLFPQALDYGEGYRQTQRLQGL